MNPVDPRTECGDEPDTATPAAPVRFRTDIRGLMALVACCALLVWIAMTFHERLDPTRSVAAGLRSSSWLRRMETAENLRTMIDRDDRVAIFALASSANDEVLRARLSILEVLGRVTSEGIRNGQPEDSIQAGVAGLLRALVDPEPMAQQTALHGLGLIARTPGPHPIDRRALAAAVADLLNDPEPSVRVSALFTIMACGDKNTETPPLLVAKLEDPDVEVRATAFLALRDFPRDLDRHLPLLLRGLDDPQVRSSCLGYFQPDRPAGFTTKVIPVLVTALGSRSRMVRRAAAGALCQLATDSRAAVAIPALMAVLREPTTVEPPQEPPGDLADPDPVPVAALALGRMAPDTPMAGKVLTVLAEIAQSRNHRRQSAAIEAIGQFGPAAEPVVPLLIQVFHDGMARANWISYHSPYVIPGALARIAPGTRSAKASVKVLIESLEPGIDVDDNIQSSTLQALVAFGAEAVPALPRIRELQKGLSQAVQRSAELTASSIEAAVIASKETGTVVGGKPRASNRPAG